MKTLKNMAKRVLFSQSACNLSGIVHSFSRDMSDLRKMLPGKGTEFYNTHPFCRLYAEQIGHLTGMGGGNSDTYSKAFSECTALSELSDDSPENVKIEEEVAV